MGQLCGEWIDLTWDLGVRSQVCGCMAGDPCDDGDKGDACIATAGCQCGSCMLLHWRTSTTANFERTCNPALLASLSMSSLGCGVLCLLGMLFRWT